MGAGWSHAYFDDENRPDKKLLDRIVPDRPITLGSYDGHSVWANSRAMELSGIDASTADPPSGIIERYPGSREPIGLFLEDPAIKLILGAMPDYTDEQRFDALMEVQSFLNSLGITTVQDAWVELENTGLYGTIPAYQRAAAEGRLSLRVIAALYWRPDAGMEQLQRMKQARAAAKYEYFRAGTVKIWQDGVMHTHTAKLLQDYRDRPGERGLSMFSQDQLNQIVAAAEREGFQVHIHADGDGALRESLDAFAFARAQNGRLGLRHHVAHLELVHPDDIPRLRQLGIIANVQPIWSTSRYYVGDLIRVKLGEERKRWMEVNRSFLEAGVTTAYGSDWFVTSPNPMDLIEAAVTRIRPALPLADKRTAVAMLPGEEVTLADAIASYTINGAFANHQEETTGSLEVGKLADIVVLDKNLFDVEPVRISETRVLLTFLGGRLVHGTLPLKANDGQQHLAPPLAE
jgi:predicted amidohydrolase YtcJ